MKDFGKIAQHHGPEGVGGRQIQGKGGAGGINHAGGINQGEGGRRTSVAEGQAKDPQRGN